MPDPHLMEIAIAPKRAAEFCELVAAVRALAAKDSTLDFVADGPTNRIVLKGVSDTHLDAVVTGLMRAIEIEIGAPQVAYRETLTKRIEKNYTYKKQTGGSGQFARVIIVFEPHPGGGFESRLIGSALPKAFVAGVEAGLVSAGSAGVRDGFPVVDVKATLVDGAHHDQDSSALSFEIAARAAFREAQAEAGVLIEPIMAVEITTPRDYAGFVVGDLRARRGDVQGRDVRDDDIVIEALVPLANLFGYANQLRVGTRGSASHATRFSHYAPVSAPHDDNGPAAPAVALRPKAARRERASCAERCR